MKEGGCASNRSFWLLRKPFSKGVLMTKKETETIEKMADEAEVVLENDYVKKDLKEKRSITKQTLYDGSKKLKHRIPKGKKV
jgi:hypothetical protein